MHGSPMNDDQLKSLTRESLLKDLTPSLKHKLFYIKLFKLKTSFSAEKCLELLKQPIPCKIGRASKGQIEFELYPIVDGGYAIFGNLLSEPKTEKSISFGEITLMIDP